MKRIHIFGIVLLGIISFSHFSVSAQMYTDTPESHWAIADIEYLAHRDYMIGMDDGNFHPDEYLTREQAIRLVNVSTGDPRHFRPLEEMHKFEDVSMDRWSIVDIANALNGARPFLERAQMLYPEQPVTRQDSDKK